MWAGRSLTVCGDEARDRRSALKVQAALGPAYQVLEFDASTARARCRAIGCTVAQIAKSLVFAPRRRGAPCWSSPRASTASTRQGRRDSRRADRPRRADFVRANRLRDRRRAPVGMRPSPTLIDDALFAFAEIWAAAGTPNAVFSLTPRPPAPNGGIRASIAR